MLGKEKTEVGQPLRRRLEQSPRLELMGLCNGECGQVDLLSVIGGTWW